MYATIAKAQTSAQSGQSFTVRNQISGLTRHKMKAIARLHGAQAGLILRAICEAQLLFLCLCACCITKYIRMTVSKKLFDVCSPVETPVWRIAFA